MATGLPVVATAVGGNPELVEDGTPGKLVEAQSPLALSNALAKYLGDPTQIDAHGRQGLLRVQERFSLDGIVSRYMALYDECLEEEKTT